MRVLLVCAAPGIGSAELVARLAAECDRVIAVDGGLALCQGGGVVPDVVLGDFDSVDEEMLAIARTAGAAVKRFEVDKDASDLDLAIDEARAIGATRVIATACLGGRPDHELAAVGALALRADLPVDVVETDVRAWTMSPTSRAEMWFAGEGSTISCMAVGGPAIVDCSGVKWPLHRARIDPLSSLGLSNVVLEGPATFRVHAGRALLLSPVVAGVRPARSVDGAQYG